MPRQSDLRYTFEPLRGDPFEVVSFTLKEGLSQPFKLELELVSHHPAIDFYRMLDLAAVFTIWRDDTPVRYVHGLVSLFQQGDTGFRRTRYTAVVEPTLARFNLRSNWRIFQGQTVRIDTEAMTLALTHRISLPNHLGIRMLEARFETDPNAPLFKRAVKKAL